MIEAPYAGYKIAIYEPYDGDLYKDPGHLVVRYVGDSENIFDVDSFKELTYNPGKKASLKGTYKIYVHD